MRTIRNAPPPLVAVFLVLLLALSGCAQKSSPPIPSSEEQMEAWKAMEKQAQGHSPRGSIQTGDTSTVIHKPEPFDKLRQDAQRPLPGMRISLRMHNADVVAVIQALARAANLSIVVSPGVNGTLNVNIVERPWSEVFKGVLAANKLVHTFDGDTIRVLAKEDLKSELELETTQLATLATRQALRSAGPLHTSITSIRFSDAKNLQKTVEKSLSKDKDGKPVGSVEVDEYTNSLVVQAVEPDMEKIGKLLARLDAPRAQIKLKAHIVETTKEVARDLGILWGGNYSGAVRSGNRVGLFGGSSVTTTTSGGTTSTDTKSTVGTGLLGPLALALPASPVGQGAGMALGMSFGKVGGNILETQLQALATENKLNIISSPSITTMDNQKAYTESGERVPYSTSTGTGTDKTYTVQFQDATMRLEITPHVIDENFIRLAVLVQKDEVDTARKDTQGNPYIVKKKTETTLIARNGETVVISGLSKLRNELRKSGVPGLQDVPILGALASSEGRSDLKDEYLIFITPTVLEDWRPGERQKSFEEVRRETDEAREAARLREQGAQQQGGRQ